MPCRGASEPWAVTHLSLTEKLDDAKGAKDRARGLQAQREAACGRAFDALIGEQSMLEELYAPLMARLTAAAGTLRKLSFSVARHANVEHWASEAEDGLIDLRRPVRSGARARYCKRRLKCSSNPGRLGRRPTSSLQWRSSAASTRRTYSATPRWRRRNRQTFAHGRSVLLDGCSALITSRSAMGSNTTALTYASCRRAPEALFSAPVPRAGRRRQPATHYRPARGESRS